VAVAVTAAWGVGYTVGMSKMTALTWRKLRDQIEIGDPIKDVCDESDLVNYIVELRERLNLKEDAP
jgi:hypothetical protein